MQSIVNRVQLIGRLGSDPEVKDIKNGKLLRINIATDASYKDKEGKKVEETQWHNLVLWNKTAELAGQLFQKGRLVAIEGSLVNSSYEDKDGNKRQAVEVVVEDFNFTGGGRGDGAGNSSSSSANSSSSKSDDVVIEDIDDKPIDLSEIPF